MDETVIVVTGAAPLPARVLPRLPDGIVLAADGGLDHALAAGLRPAGLIGDLDSISADGLAWAEAHATISRHDPGKDRTDTELALETAADLAPARVVLVSGGGDRLDHTLSALGALGAATLTSVPTLEAWWGDQYLRVVHGPGRAELDLDPGVVLSLLAAHGSCSGVSISGVEWPLDRTELAPLVGLGISNVVTEPPVEITVVSGVLTVIVPFPTEAPS